MGVPTSEVGYTSAMPRREDHEVHKGHVVVVGGGPYVLTADVLLTVHLSIILAINQLITKEDFVH